MRRTGSGRGAGLAALALLASLTLAAGEASAQVGGSVRLGRSRSTTTYENGRVQTNSQGGSLNAYFGRQPTVRHPGSRSPYGRPNYGRPPGAPYDNGGNFGYDGVHSHLWSGSIDRNYAQMRRTSPFPDRFAGGAYNPRPIILNYYSYPTYTYPGYGDFCYSGYSFGIGFSSGGYLGYVPSVYSYYGSWYPQYLPTERVYIIERERIRDRDDDDRGEPRTRSRRDADARSEAVEGREGEYYLNPSPRTSKPDATAAEPVAGESIHDAAAAIKAAWMNGDSARLLSRLSKKGKVRIYLKGNYKYSVDATDFGQMSRDAMSRIDTVSFTLDRIQRKGDDQAFVSGKHTYTDPDRQKHEVYVSYGLVKEQGRWMIAEAGSGAEPITKHAD
jgi:hypothetical protein